MNKAGIAGVGLGALALVLAVVNFSRVSGAMSRLEGIEGTASAGPGDKSPGGEGKRTLTPEERKAEIDWLVRETNRISGEVKKAREDIARGAVGTATSPDPDGRTPLPLSPADVGAVIDSLMEKKFKDEKLREADARVAMLERSAAAELTSLSAHCNFDPAQKARVETALKTQVEGYAAILRTFPPPEDKQAQLDKVTAEAEAQLKAILNQQQFMIFQKTGQGWHGFSRKVDPKRDNEPPTPRSR